MSETLFSVKDICAGYGGPPIVEGASLSLERGEFAALLGLNGCGKTTLMRALCGLLPALSGSCTADGADILCLSEKQRAKHISYIPQRSSLAYPATALEVAVMGCSPHLPVLSAPGKKERAAAQAALEALGAGRLAQRNFLHLSEGQKQLVILARAMVQDAPVMLLDEPDSALDFVNRHMVLGKMREAVRTGRRCGLVTLHDPNFALAYCDRVFLFSGGKISGELYPATAGLARVRAALSSIYGEVDVLDYCGSFVMVRGATPLQKERPSPEALAEKVLSDFMQSGKAHLFLTGSRGAGKSALRRALAVRLGIRIGVETLAIRKKESSAPEKIVLRSLAQPDDCADIGVPEEGGMTPQQAGFALGTRVLAQCRAANQPWLMVDEVGYLENAAPDYREELRACLAEKRVLAVLRRGTTPLLNELLAREDAFCVDLDEL